MTYSAATNREFFGCLAYAQNRAENVRKATTDVTELPTHDVTYYLADNGRSGYGVTVTGELISVFSLDKGNGNAIVSDAIANGATNLDCFDGFLPTLYARHGFIEVKRENNWDGPEFPDVVFMALNV